MGDIKAGHLDYRYLSSPSRLVQTHSVHHALTVPMGYIIFWTYIAGAVLVMLNMLIAMMSNSFQEIYVSRSIFSDSNILGTIQKLLLWEGDDFLR